MASDVAVCTCLADLSTISPFPLLPRHFVANIDAILKQHRDEGVEVEKIKNPLGVGLHDEHSRKRFIPCESNALAELPSPHILHSTLLQSLA